MLFHKLPFAYKVGYPSMLHSDGLNIDLHYSNSRVKPEKHIGRFDVVQIGTRAGPFDDISVNYSK